MKTIIKWIVGIIHIISSLALFQFSFIAFFFWLVAGILCLPPIFPILEKKLSIKIVSFAKYCIVIGLIVFGFVLYTDTDEFKKSEKETAIKEEKERKEQVAKEANEATDKTIIKEKQKKITTELEDSNTESSGVVGIGKIGFINTLCIGAITEEGYDEMMTLINARDEMGLDNLVEHGYALQLAKNTQVKVIETGFVKQRVRVMSGRFKGASVYLPAMVISPY